MRLTPIDQGFPMGLDLSSTPVYLGRAATNDLVVPHKAVSSRHAAVFVSGGRVFVEDLGSRNGTFVGGRRVRRIAELGPGQELVLGGAVRLRVDGAPGEPGRPLVLLEEVSGGVRVPLRADRLRIGPGGDLELPGLDDVVELRVGTDRAWLGDRLLRWSEPFRIAGRSFRLVPPPMTLSMTAEPAEGELRLEVELAGPTGPRAVLRGGERVVEWSAPNRVVLLYLLARQLDVDQRGAVAAEDLGWCDDADLATGLWGRDGVERNLNVLVTRVRNDLRKAGFDPWLLEKRPGHLRLRLRAVEVKP